jgi:(S)-2-hydroxyglutarate dehydrogenase
MHTEVDLHARPPFEEESTIATASSSETPGSVAVVGAGIIGLATAWTLLRRRPGIGLTVVEKEHRVGAHQTSHNSGVAHAGLYYKPGSLKARLCARGRRMLKDFCIEHHLAYVECGKLLIATTAREQAALQDIYDRGMANRVPGLRLVAREEIPELEPHACGLAGIHSPTTAITDFAAVAACLANEVVRLGGEVTTSAQVTGIQSTRDYVALSTRDSEQRYDHVVTCAGLHSDSVAELAGDIADPRIVPFRGDYYSLSPERRSLVKGLIYPVPDPRYPFLGIHLTRTTMGEVLVGPNAVLATAKEGYTLATLDRAELLEILRWPGFRRLVRRHWKAGAGELYRSISRRAFVRSAQRFVPELTVKDVVPGRSGVRAQAVARTGDLVDDFWISGAGRVTNLRNAPSPGATSCLAIAEVIADAVLEKRGTGAPGS